MSKKPTITLGQNASMRDVGDYCKKHGIPSLAQGMIELPPPMKLRELAAKYAVADDGTYPFCHAACGLVAARKFRLKVNIT